MMGAWGASSGNRISCVAFVASRYEIMDSMSSS